MEYKIYNENDFQISNWTGGKTQELSIFPETGSYLDRNFIWRLSSATVESDESDFSKLSGFDRVLVVLSGKAVLAHEGVRVARLDELEQDRFDGDYKTKSFGQITDYNLMTAKGNQGFLDVIIPESTSNTPEVEVYPDYELATQGYFCRDGFATISINGNIVMLQEGQQLIINYKNEEKIDVSVMGQGHLIRAQIFYNYCAEEMGPIEIPKEKLSFDDFKTCVYLSNVQFRGAKYIFKKLKTQWFDEELSAAIRKLEKAYIPFLIYLVGLCTIAFLGVSHFAVSQWITIMVAWTVVDMCVVSPLLYLLVVPKPTRKHIKDINNLTPYEEGILQEQLSHNERLEKLLKKYKHSGTARYDKDGNRLDKTFK